MAKIEGVPALHPLELICETCGRQSSNRGGSESHARSCRARRDELHEATREYVAALGSRKEILDRYVGIGSLVPSDSTGARALGAANARVRAAADRVLRLSAALYSRA